MHLAEGADLYWQVTARNACGVEMILADSCFHTRFSVQIVLTQLLPIAIPTNAVFTFNSTVSVRIRSLF